jgi:hypothetical protein
MKYQWGQVLPYWFNTWVLRRKGLKEPQLYKFDSDEYTSSDHEEVKTA